MKYVNSFLMFGWLALFISLFFGFEPSKIAIGCSFFICVLDRLQSITESR